MDKIRLTRMFTPAGQTIGYFNDRLNGMFKIMASKIWNQFLTVENVITTVVYPAPAKREQINVGEGERISYIFVPNDATPPHNWIALELSEWFRLGAEFVQVERYEINRFRKPGTVTKELAGPSVGDGILYVFRIEAPR